MKRIYNQASITSSSVNNIRVSDVSDDGDDSDGNTTNDYTEVSISASPSIEVTKTSTITDNGDGVTGKGDIIKYTITVQNKGNRTLTDLTINDNLTDLDGNSLSLSNGPFFTGSSLGSAVGSLKVSETASYIAFYIIEQAAVDAGGVSNTVTATASSPGNTSDVSDISDDGDDTDGNTENDPTINNIVRTPSIEITKTVNVTDNGDAKTGLGDVAVYTIVSENTGNVTLNSVTVSDTLINGSGDVLTLTNGPTFSGATQGSGQGNLKVGEKANYTAFYIIQQSDVDSGSLINRANVMASSPGLSNNVTDTSDNGNDADGNTTDDSTNVSMTLNPIIEVTKTASVKDVNSNGINDLGDKITYVIKVENKGNVTLTGLNFIDTLTDGDGNSLSLTNSITYYTSTVSSVIGTLKVGETETYTATYTISQNEVDSGKVINSLLVRANSPGKTNDVTDISDDGNDLDGNTENDNTLVELVRNPILEVTKTATITDNNGNNNNDQGDLITYSITVENKGNVTISNITLNDILTDDNGNNLSLSRGPTFVSSNQGSSNGILKVGETASYNASYTISLEAANSGSVKNQVIATGSSPGQSNNVSDTSDDGDDGDGNILDDSTDITTSSQPSMKVVKTATVTDNGDGSNGVNDIIVFTITVKNTGGFNLTGLTLVDILKDSNGTILSLNNSPTFVSASSGSSAGSLQANETATYTASYTITQAAADSGSIINSVIATASSPGNTNDVTDVSDDGNDTDGNTVDDNTVVYTSANPTIEATKTFTVVDEGDGSTGVGDTIVYNITVQNTGNVLLSNINLVDTFTDGATNTISLSSGPTYNSSTGTSTENSLGVGQTSTYTASYTVAQAVFETGSVKNRVTVTASSPGNTNDVTDISDDGNDSDGNTTDDRTITNFTSTTELEVTKTATVTDNNSDGVNNVGDTVTFNITVQNKSNVTLTNITVNDVLRDGNGNTVTLSSGPTFIASSSSSSAGTLVVNEIANYTATFIITQAALDSGSISNIATATGSSPGNTNDVSDQSDDGDDSDGNISNDPTIVNLSDISPSGSIEATKTAVVIDNGDGSNGLGDTILYNISVKNTGNLVLSSVTLTDQLTDGQGLSLTLTSGPSFVSASAGSSQGTLTIGETATYSATFLISREAATTGSISNSAIVTASTPGQSNNVSDTSDDGDDTDGNTINDPTVVSIVSLPKIEVTKTATVTDNNNNGINDFGDTIDYLITVENIGNITVTGLNYVDTFTDGSGNALQLTTNPTFISSTQSSTIGVLIAGEKATYTANYVIGQSAADSGKIINSILFRGNSPGNAGDVFDVSDNGDDTDGNIIDDSTIIFTVSNLSLETTKTAEVSDNGDGEIGVGDIITYTITVENKGNSTLRDLVIEDNLTDGNGNVLTLSNGPFYSGSDKGSNKGILVSGETASYIGFYIIESDAASSGKIINSVTASAFGPGSTTKISDISDDGDDSDGNTVDDPTIVFIAPEPLIEATKTASITDNGDSIVGPGDIITYTITVKNTGNIDLNNLSIEDQLSDGDNNELSLSNGPFYTGSDKGSNQGSIKVGETVTYKAFYIISQSSSDSGKIINSVLATASSPGQIDDVIDVSDDGDDTDGNTLDDPTEIIIVSEPSLEVTKLQSIKDNNFDDLTGPGDIINYQILVENLGNVALTNITLDDVIQDKNGNILSLDSDDNKPIWISSNMGSVESVLKPGEIATYEASYTIEEDPADSGEIINYVTVTGSSPGNTDDITDLSDDGDDEDGNTVDDPTITKITFVRQAIEVFNLVTPNGDKLNDFFRIKGIENFPTNSVKIFNRWGVLVFETDDYGNYEGSDNVFKGFSKGRITIQKNLILPSGTYYYVINVSNEKTRNKQYSGYLYLTNY